MDILPIHFKRTRHSARCAALLTISLLMGCGGGPSSDVQRVALFSGAAGIPFKARVEAINPILLDGAFSRYSVGIGALTLNVLKGAEHEDRVLIDEAVREFGTGVAGELEEAIRSLNCMYTVRPEDVLVVNAVGDTALSGATGASPDIDEEFLNSPEFAAMSDQEKFEYVNGPSGSSSGANYGELLVVVSQCLSWLQPGIDVNIVKFPDMVVFAKIDT